MRLTALLVLVLGTPAAGQIQPRNATPILFQTKWDAHNAQVRIRPAGDTSAAWTLRTARRHAVQTFRVLTEQSDQLFADTSRSWTVEARIAKSQLRDGRMSRGALVGGILGAAVVIAKGATCEDKHAEGPSCSIALLLTPAGAGLGSLFGRAVGAALPVREWQRVSVVK